MLEFPITLNSSPTQVGLFTLPQFGNMPLLNGIDTSYYEYLWWNAITRKWDFKATWQPEQTPTYQFHIRKCTQAGYMDPSYLTTLKILRRTRYESAFHFFDPIVNIKLQANVAVEKYKLGNFNLPIALDLEWHCGLTRKELTSRFMGFVYMVDKALDRLSIIYTGPYFWNDHMENVAISDHPLWIANYGVNRPMLPRSWKDWVIWQYSCKGKVSGLLGATDLNYGNADKLALLAGESPAPIDPTQPLSYVVVAYYLNIRSGPGSQYGSVGLLTKGMQTKVYEIFPDNYGNPWACLSTSRDRWACMMWGSNIYMQQV